MGAGRLAGLTAAAVVAVAPAAARAAPATPDAGFGGDGVVVTGFSGGASEAGMLLDAADRPVVVAQTDAGPGLLRRGPDGAPDVAPTTEPLDEDSLLTEVVEQPGGGYVVGGWIGPNGDRRFALARWTAAGSFDAGFGVVTDSPGSGDDEIRALALQPDGRIVAAGRSGGMIGVARYGSDGTPEARFGGRHDVTDLTDERVNGVAVEPSGRILLGGTGVQSGERRFMLVALTPAGAIDAGFGDGGVVTLDVGDGTAAVRAVERQPDGKLLVAGTTDSGGDGGGVVARFLPDGTPDPGFSGDGIARLGVAGAIVEDVALQPDGKVVAAGSVDAGTAAGDSIVARLRPGGGRDPGFGSDGVVRRSLGGDGPDRLTGVGVAGSGRIVAGGLAGDSIVLAALTGGDSSDPALSMRAEALGDLVTFTVSATNPGADPANGVNVTVAPPGAVAATALTTANGVCAGASCSLGTLAPGATRRITLLARARAPGPLTASARVAGATFDANLTNNAASATGTATRNRVVRRDRTRPRVVLRLRARRIGHVRERVRLIVRTNEAASVVVRTRARSEGRALTFARTRSVKLRRAGARTVRLALTRAGRRLVERKSTRRLTLAVTARARDAAGNKRTRTLRRTLRR